MKEQEKTGFKYPDTVCCETGKKKKRYLQNPGNQD